MTVIPGVTNIASAGVETEKPAFQISGNQQWLDSLTAGQILKGRIMRHYGDNRYSVSFSGQERIVDSAVPLSVGEVLTGKVVGLAEHSVHMQLVPALKQSGLEASASGVVHTKQDNTSDGLGTMMRQLGLQLDQLQLSNIAKASKGLDFPELAMRVGFFVAKHGLPISHDLIRAIYTKVSEVREPVTLSGDEFLPDAGHLETKTLEQASVIEVLQQYLVEYGNPQYLDEDTHTQPDAHEALSSAASEKEAVSLQPQQLHSGNEDTSKNSLWNFCYAALLNAQTGAVYQHKFKSLPIIVNNKIIEFDLTLFDHKKREPIEGEVQSRYLKFSLMTEFGSVTMDARVLNNRIYLQMASSQWLMKEFTLYESDLANDLQDAGWVLEAVGYASEGKAATPAEAIIHHVLEQDSLNVFV